MAIHIQLLADELTQDILFISEANMYEYMEEHETRIEGYTMYLRKSMDTMGYARIILLVKEGSR